MAADGSWHMLYPNGGDYSWGKTRPVWNITTPEIGDVDLDVADARRSRADGVDFGMDYLGGRTITFNIGVTGATEAEVRKHAADLARLWRGDSIRQWPGMLAELRATYRGQQRATFGRPRRFSADYSAARTSRFVQITADFECTDDVWYSAGTEHTTVGLVPETGGGLVAPLRAPLTTTLNSNRSVVLEIDTEVAVWPVITVSGGQITNPALEVIGLWRFGLNASLNYDESLVVNTLPWERTVLANGNRSLAGALARGSARLGRMAIPAGTYELAFSGSSTSNTATADIAWRRAYTTP